MSKNFIPTLIDKQECALYTHYTQINMVHYCHPPLNRMLHFCCFSSNGLGNIYLFVIAASASGENKNHQWFGVSLLSGGRDQFVAVSYFCHDLLCSASYS